MALRQDSGASGLVESVAALRAGAASIQVSPRHNLGYSPRVSTIDRPRGVMARRKTAAAKTKAETYRHGQKAVQRTAIPERSTC